LTEITAYHSLGIRKRAPPQPPRRTIAVSTRWCLTYSIADTEQQLPSRLTARTRSPAIVKTEILQRLAGGKSAAGMTNKKAPLLEHLWFSLFIPGRGQDDALGGAGVTGAWSEREEAVAVHLEDMT